MPNHPSRPPDIAQMLSLLDAHEVAFLLAGSVAAMLHGVELGREPGDLDIIPATDRANLERLARVISELEASITDLGEWTTTDAGEWKWMQRDATAEELAAWRADPAEPATFDHLMHTRLGNFDVVPRIAGTFEELEPNVVTVRAFGRSVRIASIADLLDRLTVPRRARDKPRVDQLRALQRGGSISR